jgi:hypothetical protein
MSNPQEPEQRRSEQSAVTDTNPEKERKTTQGKPHGTDKGGKGGGRGSAEGDPRPPEQRPPHPS